MVNCAMMGADWRELTWWEYTAMLAIWNERHEASVGKRPPSDLRKNMAAATRMH
jgi:hypothetical protein